MGLVNHIARIDPTTPLRGQRVLIRLGQFLVALGEQIGRDKVVIRASGLAYSSLLAVVPLVAVVLALLSAFGALDELKLKVQVFLFSIFLPAQHDDIAALLDQFTGNAARLGFLGFAFLLLTSILLLDSVEKSFNDIYHVASRRRLVNKITAYTAVLVVGALGVGASISISAQVEALLLRDVAVDIGWLTLQTARLFPLVLVFLAFLLAFLVVPYTRVRLKSAAIGAATSAVLFELAKNLFAGSVGQSIRASTLYGSLAVGPIFLIWLYLSWIIVLVGLEVSFTHQHFLTLLRSRLIREGAEGDRVGTGLRVFALAVDRYEVGAEPPTSDQLSRRLLVPLGAVEAAIDRLVEAKLLRRVAQGSDTEGVVPARPPDRIAVSDVVRVFEPRGPDRGPGREVEQAVERALARFSEAGHHAVAGLSFRAVIDDGGNDGRE